MKEYKFKLEGLDCANCANELENSLKGIEIIENVSISFMMQRLTFSCYEDNFKEAFKIIKKKIKKEEPDVILEEI